MTIDAAPVLIQEADGNLTTIPLGDLCCVCVKQRHDGDDYLCAECRSNWEMWQSERHEK